jgi:hypothetical protein
MNSLDWRRIESGGIRERRHTVYWTVSVPFGYRLSVARVYNDDGTFTPGGPWRWTVRQRIIDDSRKGYHEEIEHEGVASTVQGGKAAAQRAMFARG